MSDPPSIAGPLAQEAAARRAAQAVRAQRARDGEIDRRIDQETQCPECGPQTDAALQHGHHPGFVRTPVITHIYGEPREVVEDRPCFTCNPGRWQAWQEGTMRSSRRAKVETAEGRQVAEQDRRKRERNSFA